MDYMVLDQTVEKTNNVYLLERLLFEGSNPTRGRALALARPSEVAAPVGKEMN